MRCRMINEKQKGYFISSFIFAKSKTVVNRIVLFLLAISITSGLFAQISAKENITFFPSYTNAAYLTYDFNSVFTKGVVFPQKATPLALYTTLLSSANSNFRTDTIRKGPKDRDGDGIVDSLDKCPDEKGVIEYDGCPMPDSDNDGIADDSDECPTVPGLIKYKGCPPGDKDGDKINDDEDKCPNQPGVARYDGCPVGDADNDGVNDDDDKCRNSPGTVNNAGCPDEKPTISSPKTKKKK